MKAWLLDFLKALEHEIPPPEGCHYALMALRYGSDESGWADKLGVHMRMVERMEIFFLEDADFAKTPEVLAAEIATQLRNVEPSTTTPDLFGEA